MVTTLLRVLVLNPAPELPTRDRFRLLGGTGRPSLLPNTAQQGETETLR